VKVVLTDHAVARFVERVAPGMGLDDALMRLARRLAPADPGFWMEVVEQAPGGLMLRERLAQLAGCNHAAYRRWGDAMNALAERLP